MRHASGCALLTIALLGCGGGDSNDPGDPFPDVAGVYEIDGTFDDLPANDAHFEGTLELTQASQESGALGGSIAVLATLGEDIFNVSDDALSSASVSPSGVISFTAGDGSATWTFSGTASGNAINSGRHTLSSSSGNASGPWQANVAATVRAIRVAPTSLQYLLLRILDQ